VRSFGALRAPQDDNRQSGVTARDDDGYFAVAAAESKFLATLGMTGF
jgi:hypothetical protein